MIESSHVEIEASKLALQKSDNVKVISFAKRMVDEHTNVSHDLKEIAQDKDLIIPLELNNTYADSLNKLKALNDEAFDLAYIEMMKKEHEQDESLFVAACAHTTLDPQRHSFAQKNLTLVRDHIGHVKSLGLVEISSPD